VLIIKGSKLYYTASGIITLCRWPSGTQVERGLMYRRKINLLKNKNLCINLVNYQDQRNMSFFKSFIAHLVYTRCTKINYKIVPVTNFNKYLHYGTSGNE